MTVLDACAPGGVERSAVTQGLVDTPAESGGPPAKFTQGSILRHTLVMTLTGAVGTLSIFVVDLLSLLYVSWLGRTELKAAVGFATQVSMFPVAVNIGLSIAVTVAVSRALGSGERTMARRVAASGLTHVALAGGLMTGLVLVFAGPLLHLFGARGETLDIAHRYVMITAPANLIFGLGMALSGILRAVGDARRAMAVTVWGALVTAVVDPLLIFGFGFGIYGAAISTVVSRLVFLYVGFHGAVRVHRLVARPDLARAFADAPLLMRVAVPAILTNLATPVGNAYALHIYAGYGDAAVAASAIIDRIVYVSFAVVFALTGAIGPIIGQNLGARRFDRVYQTLNHCFFVTAVYSLGMWAILAVMSPLLIALFHAGGDTAAYLEFFCRFGVSAWVFVGFLFVANAAFNNLGRPTLAMVFNWGRASLGTIPFMTLGAACGGVKGAQLGIVSGAALFGLAALASAYAVAKTVAPRRSPDAAPRPVD